MFNTGKGRLPINYDEKLKRTTNFCKPPNPLLAIPHIAGWF